ncbi:MAG: AI-2E family transporter [Chlamydiia bacterium]|nr:AI-2E family transporter [Chlamydiia bacterium]
MHLTSSLLTIFLTGYLLYLGQNILIPFLIALILTYLYLSVLTGLQKRLPNLFAIPLTIFLFLAVVWLIFFLIERNVTALIASAPAYQQQFESLTTKIFSHFKMDVPTTTNAFKQLNVGPLISSIVFTFTNIAGQTGIIAVYFLFLCVEYQYLPAKIAALPHQDRTMEMLKNISRQIQKYLRIKTVLSLFTGICSYLVLVSIGVDFADFWALLIFLLNFIPTIGSIVATLFPCLLTLLQFDNLLPFFLVTTLLITLQFLTGNIIEPKVMGKHFNLSGLVILLSLMFWGQIWGIVGMFLCVPLLMILSIALSHFPKTRPIAILLSQDGNLDL